MKLSRLTLLHFPNERSPSQYHEDYLSIATKNAHWSLVTFGEKAQINQNLITPDIEME